MVVDTSVLIAILEREPDVDDLERALGQAPSRYLSAMSALEAYIVSVGRKGLGGHTRMQRIVERLGLTIVPFDAAQMEIARDAFIRFGKGRHPAALNFGDCAAYALAKQRGEPLLCKGGDFAATDLALA